VLQARQTALDPRSEMAENTAAQHFISPDHVLRVSMHVISQPRLAKEGVRFFLFPRVFVLNVPLISFLSVSALRFLPFYETLVRSFQLIFYTFVTERHGVKSFPFAHSLRLLLRNEDS